MEAPAVTGPAEARLAELLAAVSVACDLGNDFPMEKGLRNTLAAIRIGRRLGVQGTALADVFYVGLLRFVGCSAFAHETARVFDDDNGLRNAMAPVDFDRPATALRQVARFGKPRMGSARAVARFALAGKKFGEELVKADCEVMVRTARRFGLGEGVARALDDAYERWDGKMSKRGVRGEQIELPARLVAVAHAAELHFRAGGAAGVEVALRGSRGGWFDPAAVDAFARHADDWLDAFQTESPWAAVLEEEPAPRQLLRAGQLEAVASGFGEVTDLKSTYTLGHSAAVARLAEEAGRRLGLADEAVQQLRLAGHLHDLGRLSVPTGIWDKRGALSAAEWERVRLHPYHSERVLNRVPQLAAVARLVGLHHERLDGSGYFRAAPGASLDVGARVLAAADVYVALTAPRPHREARSAAAASEEVQRMVKQGQLDAAAAREVLQAAGHALPRGASVHPASLSDREVEVLKLLATGKTEKEIARALFISPGTVHTHVVHIYGKIGVSSRAGAALFAVEHHLLRA